MMESRARVGDQRKTYQMIEVSNKIDSERIFMCAMHVLVIVLVVTLLLHVGIFAEKWMISMAERFEFCVIEF